MVELAGFYFSGLTVSLLLTLFYQIMLARHYSSSRFQQLNSNLARANLFWSDQESNFKSLTATALREDQAAAKKAALIFGLLMSFMAWLGFVIFTVFLISLRYLARPRFERRVFASALARKENLSESEVQELIKELRT